MSLTFDDRPELCWAFMAVSGYLPVQVQVARSRGGNTAAMSEVAVASHRQRRLARARNEGGSSAARLRGGKLLGNPDVATCGHGMPLN